MYMRNIADIISKWKDIRIADIIPNRNNILQYCRYTRVRRNPKR